MSSPPMRDQGEFPFFLPSPIEIHATVASLWRCTMEKGGLRGRRRRDERGEETT